MTIGTFCAIGVMAALTLGALGPARCQFRPVPTMMAAEGLTTTGHGEVKVAPDVAEISISVITQSQDQAKAVRENAERTTKTLAALKAAGVAAKDMQSQSYTVQPQYDYKQSPPVLTGYQVQNSVQATVRDLSKVGYVIDKVTAAGVSQISNVSFDLQDRSKAEGEALALAVKSARSKASVMADAAGISLGRLLTITEGGTAPVQPVYAMRAMASEKQVETPIADQQITVSADATLVYAVGAIP